VVLLTVPQAPSASLLSGREGIDIPVILARTVRHGFRYPSDVGGGEGFEHNPKARGASERKMTTVRKLAASPIFELGEMNAEIGKQKLSLGMT